jgi:hypothetical protein
MPPTRRGSRPRCKTRCLIHSTAFPLGGGDPNQFGLTPPVQTTVSPYYNRPYLVIHADRIVDTLRAAIQDPAVRALPWCGAVDQLSDSTDFLGSAGVRAHLRPLYEGREQAIMPDRGKEPG